jgi:ribosomal protein S12 methylthiotransferase accessory factor
MDKYNPWLRDAVSRMRMAVDPKVGIIRSAEFMRVTENEASVFVAYADPCDTTALAGIESSNRGGACATDPERAFLRACGEAIERYCSSFFELDTLELASEEDLASSGRRYIRVSELYPFLDNQYGSGFPFERVDPRKKLRWAEIRSASTGCLALAPASCVYVPYRFDRSVEPFTHMPISTGLACGPSHDFAFEKAVLEVLERDALMIVWRRKLPTSRIRTESCKGLDSDLDLLLTAEGPGGAQWHLNLLTLDVEVPIVSALLMDRSGLPKTSFGIAADLNPLRALTRAMEEALLSRFLINRGSELCRQTRVIEIPRTLREHLLLHASSPKSREMLSFIINTDRQVDLDATLSGFALENVDLSTRLAQCGLESFYIDITTRDVRDLGFTVIRVLIPGAQPLDNDHLYPYLGGKRLQSTPIRLGLSEHLSVLNSDPHPFP